MQPIYITLKHNLSLMIIPDTQAHLDGHIIITRTYHIYNNDKNSFGDTFIDVDKLTLNRNDNPNYMGYLSFDIPGKVFSYVGDGANNLSPDEVEELIEHLNHFRDNSTMWPKQDY